MNKERRDVLGGCIITIALVSLVLWALQGSMSRERERLERYIEPGCEKGLRLNINNGASRDGREREVRH